MVSTQSKAEAEDILEDHHAGKSLDCRVRDKSVDVSQR
jgi:hypothetical protein